MTDSDKESQNDLLQAGVQGAVSNSHAMVLQLREVSRCLWQIGRHSTPAGVSALAQNNCLCDNR